MRFTHAAKPAVVALSAFILLSMLACAMGGTYKMASMPAPAAVAVSPTGEPLLDVQMAEREFNTESYSHVVENPFLAVANNPLSTFAADVDTASYANVRRFLGMGQLPPPDAVRIEELINYFTYDYEPPRDGPFAAHLEVTHAPWNREHLLARVGLKARELPRGQRPPSNLVFLIDVSGSMSDPHKLPLLKKAFRMLVDQLDERDRVALVVYAGDTGVLLQPTGGEQKDRIASAIEKLGAGGSTNGAGGIELAYRIASENFRPGGVNRVVLATDGDFNVGVTSEGSLVRLIEEKAKTGVFLTVLGFGMGNYKDSTVEKLADKGKGNYAYIDAELEAKKVLVEEMGSTLVTVAKDVKLQVEFNPVRVASWRLIGYENRVMRAEDFKDDQKDAGAVGAGHAVTALYELVPAGRASEAGEVGALKYQKARTLSSAAASEELFSLKIRYKDPEAAASHELTFPAPVQVRPEPSHELRFAASVAAFGMLLRDSPNKGAANFDLVLSLAEQARGQDPGGYRGEFAELVRGAARLKGSRAER
ncbi:MAG TPA: VWA domain-containing protein [Myxococcales bacterium]|jgi:Ca-activated chloride channel family protein